MIKELVKMANHLDNLGHRDLADSIDGIISKVSFEENPDADGPRLSLSADPETGAVSVLSGDGDADGDSWEDEVASFDEAQAQPLDDLTSVAASGSDLIEKRASLVNDLSQLFIDESSFYSR